MTSSDSGRPESRPRRAVAGVVLIVLVATGAVAYIARQRLVEAIARNWLGHRGVASSLKIQALSLTGLTASLRLGDPSDPDLTVDRVEVGYALSGPWNGRPIGVQTRSLRLVRPSLRLRLSGATLKFGALQSVIDELARRPPSGGPQPDVTVQDGAVLLQTPGGQVRLRGDAQLKSGVLTTLIGSLEPYRLTIQGFQLDGRGGALRVVGGGDRLQLAANVGPIRIVHGAIRLSAATALLSAELPYHAKQGRWAGPTTLALVVAGVSANSGQASASGGTLNADIRGTLDANTARQALSGRMLISGQFASAVQRGARARDVVMHLDLAHVEFTREPAGFTVLGEGGANLAAAGTTASGAEVSFQTNATQVRGLRILARDGRVMASATLDGGLAGRGAFTTTAARRLAQGVPILSSEAPYAKAMERGLRAFHFASAHWRAEVTDHGARLILAAPLRTDTGSGAHLSLTAPAGLQFGPRGVTGAADLVLDGGGMPTLRAQLSNGLISQSGLQADVAVQGALDALLARGFRFQVKGRLIDADRRLRYDLAGCAPVSARRMEFDPNPVTAFAATVCPGSGPLIQTGPWGWKAQGRLKNVGGDVANVAAGLRAAGGDFRASGRAGLDAAVLSLDQGELIDATDPIRFRPLNLAGRADLADGAWTGDFRAATRAGHPIGAIRFRHGVATGAGRADIESGPLTFVPDGLQPAELSPLANFASQASGSAIFKGWFSWRTGEQTASGGELVAKSFRFRSPLGQVQDIDTRLQFVSLAPLVTAPGQRIAAGEVKAIVPLNGLSAQFNLNADSFTIETASGSVAQGSIHLEPTVSPLAGGSIIKGALVLDHVHVGDFIAASSLAGAVKLDAVVDGRIPFELGPSGLTIRQGRLDAVGPGRLSISRKALGGGSSVNPPTLSVSAPGQGAVAQDLAFQAMEDLAFDVLDASVISLPGDRLGMLLHIRGRHDPPQRQRAEIGLGDIIRGRALTKPLTLPSGTEINLTLDISLNFGELVKALRQAWRDGADYGGGSGRSPPVQSKSVPVMGK